MPVTKVASRDKLPVMPKVKLFYIEDEAVLVRQLVLREEVSKADVATKKAEATAQIAATTAKKDAELTKQNRLVAAMDEALAAFDEAETP